MHPQIVRAGPGSCPICGMALEPMTPAGRRHGQSRAARHDAAVLGCVRAVGSAARHGHGRGIPARPAALIAPRARDLGAADPRHAGGAVGRLAVFRARLGIRSSAGVSTCSRLIALGTGVAYVYSLVAALAPGIFPPSFRIPDGAVPLYFEAAAVIVTLVLLGQVLELRARSQTGSAIRALLDLAPKRARRLHDDGNENDIPLEEVVARRPPAGAARREGAGRRRRARRPQRRRRSR